MTDTKNALLYRMVMEKHICPWGLKARYLLKKEGFKAPMPSRLSMA
jgi:hypothetical protein